MEDSRRILAKTRDSPLEITRGAGHAQGNSLGIGDFPHSAIGILS